MICQSQRLQELMVLSYEDIRGRTTHLRNKAAMLGHVLSQEAAPEIRKKKKNTGKKNTPYFLAHFESSWSLS